jgi:hypothetical protein
VEDTDNEEYSDSYTADEEAAISAENQALLNGEPMTPTTKLDTVLGATRAVRKSVRLTEADEIWGVLQDDDAKTSPRPLRRASTLNAIGINETESTPAEGEEPDENTALLRSSTFSRRRRRRSTGFPGFTARPSPRSSKRRSTSSQGALGGLWKMRWWNRDRPDSSGGPGGEGPAGAL